MSAACPACGDSSLSTVAYSHLGKFVQCGGCGRVWEVDRGSPVEYQPAPSPVPFDPWGIYADWLRAPFEPRRKVDFTSVLDRWLQKNTGMAATLGVPKDGEDHQYGGYLVRFHVGGILYTLSSNNNIDGGAVRAAFSIADLRMLDKSGQVVVLHPHPESTNP